MGTPNWLPIGSRCYDRGQFIHGHFDGNTITWGPVGWRKGRWVEKQKIKKSVNVTEEDKRQGNKGHEGEEFEFYGPIYQDYECKFTIWTES